MITLEQVVAAALRDVIIMDGLGDALKSDLVTANPFYRRCVEFADDFLSERRKLPGDGDWALFLESLPEGNIRDGTRETLGRLRATSVGEHDPNYFVEVAIEQLRQGAAQVAKARLNEVGVVDPALFDTIARKLEDIQPSGLQGLAHLSDVEVWAVPDRVEDRIPTGFATLDRMIGGWGKELAILFADSGAGKSMVLQNWGAAAAVRGNRVLHVTLELGLRPQILRYYRQIAGLTRGEMTEDPEKAKRLLKHWVRLAQGEVMLLELPAYEATLADVRKVIERIGRTHGDVDVLVLDYMDLLAVGSKSRSHRNTYENLGVLTHELREVCKSFDMTVLTASQAVRKPQNKDRLTIKDMGDSYGKVRGCDLLMALDSTGDEDEMNQGCLRVLKARDSGGRGMALNVYINREMSLIAELDHPSTIKLMRRLGHLPSQLAGQSALPSAP